MGAELNPARRLHALGQSLWLDSINRGMLRSGALARYVSELDVTGLTSNPTILGQVQRGLGRAPRRDPGEGGKAGRPNVKDLGRTGRPVGHGQTPGPFGVPGGRGPRRSAGEMAGRRRYHDAGGSRTGQDPYYGSEARQDGLPGQQLAERDRRPDVLHLAELGHLARDLRRGE